MKKDKKHKNKYYVYVLLDPRYKRTHYYKELKVRFSHKPYYIGMGQKDRQYQHYSKYIYNRGKSAKNDLVKKLLNLYSRDYLKKFSVKIYENLSFKDACNKEIRLIKGIGRKDKGEGVLLNHDNGGKDAEQLVSEENIKKRSLNLKLKHKLGVIKQDGVNNHQYGKRGDLNSNSKKVVQIDLKNLNVIKIWGSGLEAERNLKISKNKVGQCCRKVHATAGGYGWMFYDDYLENGIDNNILKRKQKVRIYSVNKFGEKIYFNSVKDAAYYYSIHNVYLTYLLKGNVGKNRKYKNINFYYASN